MPRKDPMTGCMVMTVDEFWEHEARDEGQGRTGLDLEMEFYAEMSADCRREERSMRDTAVQWLAGHMNDLERWYDLNDFSDDERDSLPHILEVFEAEAEVDQGFTGSSLSVTVWAWVEPGRFAKIKGWYMDWPDTRWEPGDYDGGMEVEYL